MVKEGKKEREGEGEGVRHDLEGGGNMHKVGGGKEGEVREKEK